MHRPWLNPWLLAPLLVALGAVMLIVQTNRVPTRAEWKVATDAIRAAIQPGEGVTFTPPWAGEGRLFLHGLPAFELIDGEQPDLARHDAVWLIGAFGHDASDLNLVGTVRQTFGPLTLERVAVTQPRVRHDLRAELDRARVRRVSEQRGGKLRTIDCDFWDGRAWYCGVRGDHDAARACLARPTARRFKDRRRDPRCGLPEWFGGNGRYRVSRGPQPVGRDRRVIGGAARECVWFTPPSKGRGEIEWPVDSQDGVFVLQAGFTDHVLTDHMPQSFKDGLTQPATITVRRGETKLGEFVVKAEPGWHRAVFEVEGAGPITLSVTSGSDVNAHLCIDATIREAGQ
ncbi:MAG: hypothetical protein ACI9U2_002202 [Bradymonadia bacterium]|jgi:hypothetical protein